MKKVGKFGISAYQPTVITSRHVLTVIAYCGIFPNKILSHQHKNLTLSRQNFISRPRQGLCNIWNKISMAIYIFVELLQFIAFIHYINSSEVISSIRLEMMFWVLSSGTCFCAIVIRSVSGGYDPVIKLLNEWAALELEICGNR